MTGNPTQVRRRVTQACENCRALKSRCDGVRPVCDRCKGYGYKCRWKQRHGRFRRIDPSAVTPSHEEVAPPVLADLSERLQAYRDLLNQLKEKADVNDQERIDATLSDKSVPSTGVEGTTLSHPRYSNLLSSLRNRRSSTCTQRYLGEVSDVSFFNSVRGLLASDTPGFAQASPLESYEKESGDSDGPMIDSATLELPNREAGDVLIRIYFSTIHIAYPFLCKQQFMEDYESFCRRPAEQKQSSWFRAVLLTLFAIGSYYNDCTLSTIDGTAALHATYFQHAVLSACKCGPERCIENVRVLLLQCFYLLATCETDRAWMTLGLAIRISQSIGLHIEASQSASSSQISEEFQKRTWYSTYVLDRLLSLQLGRPSAIRRLDCSVRLPSRFSDDSFELELDRIPASSLDEPLQPQSGDYFIAVIQFSNTVGHVLRDVYRPSMTEYSENMLARTAALDAELLDWRAHLPRWLRFDRGHPFENSPLLRRQRNMLGMKFHHLRALIHRPYLCLPWLTRNDSGIKSLLETHSHRIVFSERICVEEAQATAHMLHNVTDKRSLVEDFPWWQMISCLMCATSILLVMRAFSEPASSRDHQQMETMEEDADTCLKVFDALSTSSDAAQLAKKMLTSLRRSQVQASAGRSGGSYVPYDIISTRTPMAQIHPTQISAPGVKGDPPVVWDYADDILPHSNESGASLLWDWQDWPSEIADSMIWSSRFLDFADSAE